MEIPFASGLRVRFLLVASFSSLVACSSVLQANRLSRSYPQQPAEIVADGTPEPVLLLTEDQRLDAEATYRFPRSVVSGYRWVFIVKKGAQNTPGLGNWVAKSNQ